MPDIRIHELPDSQSSYDKDIVVVVDDPTFTNAKKLPLDVIYPKTNTLSATGDFNPATTFFRMDNDSGAESKLSVTNMLSDADTVALLNTLLNLSSSAISFTDISPANVILSEISGVRFSKVQCITGRLRVSGTTGAEYNIVDINGYQSPGFSVWFPLSASVNTNENAFGVISPAGRISMKFFNNGDWNFSVSPIGL